MVINLEPLIQNGMVRTVNIFSNGHTVVPLTNSSSKPFEFGLRPMLIVDEFVTFSANQNVCIDYNNEVVHPATTVFIE